MGAGTNLLLLHQLSIGAVVNDILAKDRGGQDGIDFFGADITNLAVQDKLVAVGADADSCPAAEKDEGEDIAVLIRAG